MLAINILFLFLKKSSYCVRADEVSVSMSVSGGGGGQVGGGGGVTWYSKRFGVEADR